MHKTAIITFVTGKSRPALQLFERKPCRNKARPKRYLHNNHWETYCSYENLEFNVKPQVREEHHEPVRASSQQQVMQPGRYQSDTIPYHTKPRTAPITIATGGLTPNQ